MSGEQSETTKRAEARGHDVKRREFLKRTATTMGGVAAGVGIPAGVILPNLATLAKFCPVNTFLKNNVSAAALALPWSAAAQARLEGVPAGFMREIAHRQSAQLAHERGEAEVSAETVHQTIARVTTWMNHATDMV